MRLTQPLCPSRTLACTWQIGLAMKSLWFDFHHYQFPEAKCKYNLRALAQTYKLLANIFDFWQGTCNVFRRKQIATETN
jgi:hypothetical protein